MGDDIQKTRDAAVRTSLLEGFSGKFRCYWNRRQIRRVAGRESPNFPGSSPNFPRSFSATSPEVLSLWSLTAIQAFPGSFPDFPRSFSTSASVGQPLSLGSLTASPDSQKLSLMEKSSPISRSARCYLCQGLGTFRQGNWLLENRPRLRERYRSFCFETATAFLSFVIIICKQVCFFERIALVSQRVWGFTR